MRNSVRVAAALSILVAVLRTACAEVELDAKQRDNLGIRTERPQVVAEPRVWPAAALVLDVAPLLGVLSDLHAAETAAAASSAELARTEQLHRGETNVALKTVEAARSQVAADGGHVVTTKSQLLANWGPAIASLSAMARQRLLDDLLSGRISLVRVEPSSPMSPADRIGRAQLQSLDDSRTWTANFVGPLPQANVPSVSGAFLFTVATSLPAGHALTARVEETGTSVRGLSVPLSAIIHWRGAEWIYEETQPNHFERRQIKSGMATAGRVVIEGGADSGRPIVTTGSRALLAAEQGAPAKD
jgi:hypothetical protein